MSKKKSKKYPPMSASEWWTRWLKRLCGPGTILVFKEKHRNRYFLADTVERTAEAFRSVLVDRYGPEGWWGSAKQFKREAQEHLEDLEVPEIPEKDIDGIKYDSVKKQAREAWEDFRKKQKEYEVQIRLWGLVIEAVKKGADALLAVEVASSMQHYEYEGFDWEQLDNVKDTIYRRDEEKP